MHRLKKTIMTSVLMTTAMILSGTASAEPFTVSANPIFDQGEELVFGVSWMGIHAGTITITLEDPGSFRFQPAFKGTVIGETSKTFSVFFRVRDVITSIFSKEGMLSLYYNKNIREGKYGKIRTTVYDQSNQIAITNNKVLEILPESRDPIACIFALRTVPLEIPSVIRMNANSDGKNYPVEIKLAVREEIDTPIGKMNAVKCEPLPTWEGRVFEKDKSQVVLWLSDDEYRVPLKIWTKVKIGSISAELIARKGPGWQIQRKDE
ncbi:DUF3108 domain-containing protein [bacterium]|nr:DUF3108 domain-containing protein [candidate division CSSED10-310 bacterium]